MENKFFNVNFIITLMISFVIIIGFSCSTPVDDSSGDRGGGGGGTSSVSSSSDSSGSASSEASSETSSAASSEASSSSSASAPNSPQGLDLDSVDDTGLSNSDDLTNISAGLTISGTADPSVIIILTSDQDGLLTTTPALITSDGSGNWTAEINLTANLVHNITAVADDSLLQSAPSAPLMLTIDNQINAPLSLDLDIADDTGASNNDNITNMSSNLTVSGSADPSVTIILTSDQDGVLITSPAVITSDGSGNWTADVSLSANLTHSITAVADDSLQQSSLSLPLSITIDSQINAPSGLDLDSADDTGLSNTDNFTNISTALTVSGTADPGVAIIITSSQDGVLTTMPATVTSDGSGNWTADVSLTANYTHSITAVADDSFQQSSVSLPLVIVIDNQITAPSALDLASSDDSGSSNADNITTVSTSLSISGTADPNVIIILTSSQDGVLTTTPAIVAADVSGNWTADVNLTANLTHSITAMADDSLQQSASSLPLVIIIDNLISVPSGLDLDISDDSGTSSSDNLTKSTTSLTISGTADPDVEIILSSSQDGVLTTAPATILTDGSGNWTADVNLTANMTHSITAVADDSLQQSSQSAPLVITTDTQADAPTALDLASADDSGTSDFDNITYYANNLTISGNSEANAAITLFSSQDGTLTTNPAAVTANSSGYWSADISLTANLIHQIYARASDSAGNLPSGDSAAMQITIDTQISIPTIALDSADDMGQYNNDNLTNLTTLTFSGTADVNSDISLSSSVDGLLTTTPATVTADGSGNWTADVTLNENTHTITVTATDIAGNADTGTISVTIDISVPSVTVEQAAAQADPANISPINFTVTFSEPVSDFTTGDVTISGTAGGTKTGTVSGSGTTYNVAVSGMTSKGMVLAAILTAAAHDAAGNENSSSTSSDNSVSWFNNVQVIGTWAATTSGTINNLAKQNGSNRILLVFANARRTNNSASTVTTITWGGRTLTKISERTYNGTNPTVTNSVWYLNETGVNAAASPSNLAVTWNGTPTTQQVWAVFLQNADQIASYANLRGGDSANTNITSSAVNNSAGDMGFFSISSIINFNDSAYTISATGFTTAVERSGSWTFDSAVAIRSFGASGSFTPGATRSNATKQTLQGFVIQGY